MTTTPETMLRPTYRVESRQDKFADGRVCWVVSHPDLPGCVAYAETQNEALDLLDDARALYLASLRDSGESIPVASPAPQITAYWNTRIQPATTVAGNAITGVMFGVQTRASVGKALQSA